MSKNDDRKPVKARTTERRFAVIPNQGEGDQAYVEMHEGAGRVVEITEAYGKFDKKGGRLEPVSVSVNIDQLRDALDLAEELLTGRRR